MVRSAGVSDQSRHRVSAKDLEWADLVLVMERKYQTRILEMFREQPNLPRIVSLDIPDEYERMDQELIGLIHTGTEFHLKQHFNLEPAAAIESSALPLGNSNGREKVCTGRDLAEVLKDIELPVDEARAWYRDLVEARKNLKWRR